MPCLSSEKTSTTNFSGESEDSNPKLIADPSTAEHPFYAGKRVLAFVATVAQRNSTHLAGTRKLLYRLDLVLADEAAQPNPRRFRYIRCRNKGKSGRRRHFVGTKVLNRTRRSDTGVTSIWYTDRIAAR